MTDHEEDLPDVPDIFDLHKEEPRVEPLKVLSNITTKALETSEVNVEIPVELPVEVPVLPVEAPPEVEADSIIDEIEKDLPHVDEYILDDVHAEPVDDLPETRKEPPVDPLPNLRSPSPQKKMLQSVAVPSLFSKEEPLDVEVENIVGEEMRVANMSSEEAKRQCDLLRAKFTILYQNNKIDKIPDINRVSLSTMNGKYQKIIKEMKAKKNSGLFKLCLIIMWLAMEYLASKMGFNASGFTKTQMRYLSYYDDILLELGEEYDAGLAFNWRPEIRIMLASAGSMVIFLLASWASNVIGKENANILQDGFVSLMTGRGSETLTQIGNFIEEKIAPVVETATSSAPGAGGIASIMENMDIGGIVRGLTGMLGGQGKGNEKPKNGPTRTRNPKFEE